MIVEAWKVFGTEKDIEPDYESKGARHSCVFTTSIYNLFRNLSSLDWFPSNFPEIGKSKPQNQFVSFTESSR